MHSGESVIVPGLIDLHSHLPQYPSAGRGAMEWGAWMARYVSPLEREFNAGVAAALAPRFFESLARNGTTCAMLHAAVYPESCDAAFAGAVASGMRVVLGKLMMDERCVDVIPAEKSAEVSLAQSEKLCRKWHGQDEGRLHYAFSPRSVAGCSTDLLAEIGILARKYDAFVQIHVSEVDEEVQAVRRRFPGFRSEIEVLESCGLLTDRTILSSCSTLLDTDIPRWTNGRAGIAHCPTADLAMRRGILPVDQVIEAGIAIGLGSDVASGPELDLWRVMRSAVESQQARSYFVEGVRVPTVVEIFHLATQGAADALGLGMKIGSIDIGKEADLVVMNPLHCLPLPRFERYPLADLSAEEILTLLIYRGGPHAVVETVVRGRSVFRAPEPLLL
jgi:guanine deaminase